MPVPMPSITIASIWSNINDARPKSNFRHHISLRQVSRATDIFRPHEKAWREIQSNLIIIKLLIHRLIAILIQPEARRIIGLLHDDWRAHFVSRGVHEHDISATILQEWLQVSADAISGAMMRTISPGGRLIGWLAVAQSQLECWWCRITAISTFDCRWRISLALGHDGNALE